MERIMEAMTDRSRTVDGKPCSLLDLGYDNVGLDDGWQKCGAGVNGSFHSADGVPIVDETKFPSMVGMVDKAHSLGLKCGWYMNNCICSEHEFKGDMIATVMKGSVAALRKAKFDGLKLDSCSQFNDLGWWNKLINETGPPVLVENCHQGGNAPGSEQWQTYFKNKTVPAGEYMHDLGYIPAGGDAVPFMANVSLKDCLAQCSGLDNCSAVSFAEGNKTTSLPSDLIEKCYVKKSSQFIGTGVVCKGEQTPSECPFNFFRTSGDINANYYHVLGNLGTVTKFMGNNSLSRPGGWAYPDMLEVGKLKTSAEDRSHFSMWSIVSSPLILGFDMSNSETMSRVWPIITNREVIAVNQAWAGSAGQLIYKKIGSQVWSKPLGNGSYAVLLLSNRYSL
jgi:alpha-galactosidase